MSAPMNRYGHFMSRFANVRPAAATKDGAREDRYLSLGLFTTLFASWLVAPLGVLTLHFSGLGSDPLLVVILIALSVGAPFQLLLNEFLAVGQAKGTHHTPVGLLVALMMLHAAASLFALTTARQTQWNIPMFPDMAMIVSFISVNLLMSYFSVRYTTSLLVRGRLSHAQSWLNGALPGVMTFALYAMTAWTGWRIWLFMALALPGLAHLIYFKVVHDREDNHHGEVIERPIPSPSIRNIILAGLALIIITYVGSHLRVAAIEIFPNYSAVLLVLVNMFGTVALTGARLIYLSPIRPNSVGIQVILLTVSLTVAVLLMFNGSGLYLFFAIVFVQIIAVTVVDGLRTWGKKTQLIPSAEIK